MMKYPELDNPKFSDPRRKLNWPYTRAEVADMVAFVAKEAGDLAKPLMKKLGITWLSFEGEKIEYKGSGKSRHYDLIYAATWEKVKQNPKVKSILLKTGNLNLKPDHNQKPSSPPAYKYFKIYMKIRKQLQEQQVAHAH